MSDIQGLDKKYNRMIETPVEKLICTLAIPTISIMLVSALYNMADTYFVGSLGNNATAAVGVSFSFMNIIHATGFFFGQGSGNYISRQLGAQNLEAASSMATTGFLSSMMVGCIVAFCGITALEPLARFLGATETFLPYTCDYLFFILIGTPWMASSLTLNHILRYQGSAFYGMIGMVTGAVINVGLDPLFIFTFKMGVSGAGLATMLSQLVGFCLLLAGCSLKNNIRINVRKFSPRLAFYKEIFRGGLPSLLRQGFASIATICLNQVAGHYGVAVVAAISVVQRITMLANSLMLGFGQGFQPVCGFSYGAKRYDRVKKAFWFSVKTASVILLLLAVSGYCFAPQIIALFRRDDPEVIRIGALALRLQCVTFPLLGWITLSNMMFQSIGKALKSSILAFSRQGLFLLPVLFILTPFLDVLGIQLSQPISDIGAFLVAIPLALSALREMPEAKHRE